MSSSSRWIDKAGLHNAHMPMRYSQDPSQAQAFRNWQYPISAQRLTLTLPPGKGQSRFGRFLGPGRTWWTSEVRGKGPSGPLFGINAMCQAGLGPLYRKGDHGLAHGRHGTVQSGFGRFLGPEWTWWTSEVRGKGSSGHVLALNNMSDRTGTTGLKTGQWSCP